MAYVRKNNKGSKETPIVKAIGESTKISKMTGGAWGISTPYVNGNAAHKNALAASLTGRWAAMNKAHKTTFQSALFAQDVYRPKGNGFTTDTKPNKVGRKSYQGRVGHLANIEKVMETGVAVKDNVGGHLVGHELADKKLDPQGPENLAGQDATHNVSNPWAVNEGNMRNLMKWVGPGKEASYIVDVGYGADGTTDTNWWAPTVVNVGGDNYKAEFNAAKTYASWRGTYDHIGSKKTGANAWQQVTI